MRVSRLRTFLLLVLMSATLLACASPEEGREPTLILISLDGFRWDYFERVETPNMDRLMQNGVRARWMVPVFPTKTFPNHYSIVTGLYPANHGIVSNNIYDPEFDARFSLSAREEVQHGRWWGGEPIWATAVRQGKKSATMYWPGSEAPVDSVRPTYWHIYDGDVSSSDRVAQAMAWLELPAAERPIFLSLYFSQTDNAGHDYGPESPRTEEAIREVDGVIGELIAGLEERELLEQVNVVIVSDHGMAATSPERVILLDEAIDLNRVQVDDWNPLAALRPEEDYFEEAFRSLSSLEHASVYRREDTPAEWRYRDNRRIAPLLLLADEGWSITTRARFERDPGAFAGGTHGYDNRLESMRSIFLAHGPAFRKGLVSEPFAAVDVYALLARVLGLEPAPHDGDEEATRHLLAAP